MVLSGRCGNNTTRTAPEQADDGARQDERAAPREPGPSRPQIKGRGVIACPPGRGKSVSQSLAQSPRAPPGVKIASRRVGGWESRAPRRKPKRRRGGDEAVRFQAVGRSRWRKSFSIRPPQDRTDNRTQPETRRSHCLRDRSNNVLDRRPKAADPPGTGSIRVSEGGEERRKTHPRPQDGVYGWGREELFLNFARPACRYFTRCRT